MHNHDQKSRDMARSVLPSTGRRRARQARAIIHQRERARLRGELHALARHPDPDDFDGDLTWCDRGEMGHMISTRRAADKVAPLIRWAETTIARDPVLHDASPSQREAHFATLLPPGLIGQHALSHLWWALGHRNPRWATLSPSRTNGAERHEDRDRVEAIVAAGAHGELNRRLRAALEGRIEQRTVWERSMRIITDTHPAPGILIPARTISIRTRIPVRYLAGAHDIAAFVADADLDTLRVVRAHHQEIIGAARTTGSHGP